MQLEGAPLELDVVLVAKLIDPTLADVAVRSDEVAVNGERRAHSRSPFPSPFRAPASIGARWN